MGEGNGEDAPASLLERAAVVSSWQTGLLWAGGIKKEGRDQEQQQEDG